MMPKDDLLFAIDGVLGQVAVGKHFYESQDVTALPLDSIAAALMVLRTLIDEQSDAPAQTEDGECKHPENATEKTDVGGGNYYITCHACNEIIEQSND